MKSPTAVPQEVVNDANLVVYKAGHDKAVEDCAALLKEAHFHTLHHPVDEGMPIEHLKLRKDIEDELVTTGHLTVRDLTILTRQELAAETSLTFVEIEYVAIILGRYALPMMPSRHGSMLQDAVANARRRR